MRCIISFLYIKPQHYNGTELSDCSCIISFLYIKPQHIPLTSLAINYLILLLGNMRLLDEAYHDTKLLKKLQLNWFWLLFCRNFAPHINNIGVLLIGYSEDANHTLVGASDLTRLMCTFMLSYEPQ